MKRSFFVLSFLMLALCFHVQAQDVKVEDVINKYLKSTGGADNWKKITSMKATGKMSMQNMEFPMVIYRMPEKKQRVEADVQGKQIVQAYDGKDAWWINPFMGGTDAQPMPDEMAAEMKQETFEDAFIDYKKKGHTAELEGKETIDGTETYKVKFTKKEGDVKYYFFDTENFVPIMVRSTVKEGQAKGQQVETFISDYQEVNGLVVPHYMEVRMNGQAGQKITLETITFNEKFDESIFAFPKK